MKNKLLTFLERPIVVIAVSLIIAFGIGTYEYIKINAAPPYTFVTAQAGNINDQGTSSGTSTQKHLTLSFLASGRIETVSVKVGDAVTSAEILASLDAGSATGALTQAEAAYSTAKANYDKVINGATGTTIDASKTAVANAESNLTTVTNQQTVAVANAYSSLLNSTPQAYPADPRNSNDAVPIISGTYTLGKEGDITIHTYASGSQSGVSFDVSGLATGPALPVSTITPEAVGNSGLYIQFASPAIAEQTWIISIPNLKASNYLANYNAYQTALKTKDQMIASAQSALDQANSNLAVVASTARPEDVASAQAAVNSAYGAVQIAQAAVKNTTIIAPGDGVVTAVYIAPGQIASPNSLGIDLVGNTFSQAVAVMIPNSAITTKDGKYYVQIKTAQGIVQKEITVGLSDDTNTEVTSGLAVGDQVVSN